MSVQRLQIPLLSLSAELVGLIQVIGVTGFVLTKLDGTARGGCVVSIFPLTSHASQCLLLQS
jgi:hypothetical protein